MSEPLPTNDAKKGQTTILGNRAVVGAGLVVGFFVVQPAARSQPVLVNGFLILVLVGILLVNRDRWLPLLNQLAVALGGHSDAKTVKRKHG